MNKKQLILSIEKAQKVFNEMNKCTNKFILQDSINKIKEAIFYTHCCTELKDKESQAFEDWIDFEGYRDEYNDLLSNGFAYDIGLLHKKHNEFLKHSL